MMMKYAYIAAVTGILTCGGAVAGQAADTTGQVGTIRYAQMNSPGDGLDKEAASEGNGRSARRAAPQRKKSGKRTR